TRIFTINDLTSTPTAVQLKNMVLTNGKADYGAAVWNAEKLTLTHLSFTNNQATSNGGAIFNSPASSSIANASILLQNSTLTGNSAVSEGGAIFNSSGVSITLSDVTFSANSAAVGGSISNRSGTFDVSRCTFNTNTATNVGGAIYSQYGTYTLTNSTISGNSAQNRGGGLYNDHSTITVNNSTFAYNSSATGGGITVYYSTLNLNSSIVGYNAASGNPDIDNSGSTINTDHSLVATTTGHTISDGDNGNIVGQEALLDILRDNGGPTKTHMLLAASPAIGTGDNPLALATDQRGAGFDRVIGSVDMGAVETDAGLLPGSWIVSTTDDVDDGNLTPGSLSLREAISNAPGGATLTFDATAFPEPTAGTITLTSQLVINKPLTIDGDNRVTLNGNELTRIFTINDLTSTPTAVQLKNMVLTNGKADNGAAVWNAEKLTLTHLSFTNNQATSNGGAIFNSPASSSIANASILLQNSTFTGNSAVSEGGAIFNSSGVSITLSDVTFSANHSTNGGAIQNSYGIITATGSTFNANSATNVGGAIYSYYATSTLTNSTVSGNSSQNSGGGLYNNHSTINVNNSTVAYNSGLNSGGGITAYYSTLNLNSSMVGYNAASSAPDVYNQSNTSTITADHSLIATTTGHAIADGIDGNIVGQEAMLFPLGNYGGSTQTHALRDTSPCISTGSNALALTLDQRGSGFLRKLDVVDMGAVEYMTNTQLSVSIEGNGSGLITSSPAGIDCGLECSASFDPNMTVTLTATPGLETVFSGWSGACSGSGDCIVSMDQARSVTATFTLNTYLLSVTKDGTGSGSVASNPVGIDCGSDCSQAYDYNTLVTLSASPDTGSTFTGWSGACSGAEGCTVTIDQARSVTATFTLNQYTVTANAAGTGSGAVVSDVGGISYTYPAESSDTSLFLDHSSAIILTATADTGSTVTWSGCAETGGTTTAATCSFASLDSAKTATATFTLNQYTVTANAAGNGNGTIVSDAGEISYTYPTVSSDTSSLLDHGSAITLTATADTGSTVTWSGCAETGGTSTAATCSFASLDNNKLVTATFTLDTYSLAITLEGNGTVTSSPEGIDCGLNCEATYDYNTEVTLTAIPAAKSVFKGWSGACSGTDNTCVVTVDQALSVGASFQGNFPWTMFLPAIMNSAKK
ncbi:MAG: choice-of-anchor Q domain-containing protein, partial [Pseudomonadota bacterium]